MKPWTYLKVKPDLKVKVDKEDLERVSQHSWRVTKGTTGRRRVVTSIRTGEKVKTVTLGAFLMKPPKGKQVYPRRFNEGLDYRKFNLIVCTLSERQRLLPKKRTSATSTFREFRAAKDESGAPESKSMESRSTLACSAPRRPRPKPTIKPQKNILAMSLIRIIGQTRRQTTRRLIIEASR